ncbi:MAG: FeoB small GTPase domain-containing protein, partial [Ruminococcus sp.]
MQSHNTYEERPYIIALAGNPNAGKSTLFNALTGMRQHTGNWAGKTVESASGRCSYNGMDLLFADLPGIYSLTSHSAEEKAARDFICNENPDAVIAVCDSTCIERGLVLALQIKAMGKRLILCAGLKDEAEKQNICIDCEKLSELIEAPVISISARKKEGLNELLDCIENILKEENTSETYSEPPDQPAADDTEKTVQLAERICSEVVSKPENCDEKCRRADRIVLGKYTGFPLLFLLLGVVLWITIAGANYPSALLQKGFSLLGEFLYDIMADAPSWLSGILLDGIYNVLTWVIAVMLPPMAIFFPLFTLLEDWGYLPRVAFNLDRCFRKCDSCGKQSLTMCMGFGCNAAGVVGCRIIDSERERLIAILTNAFVPCNGRFPALITLITIFFVGFAGGLSGFLSALYLAL